MQIRTIWKPFENVAQFDMEINGALTGGWRLTKREVLPGEAYTPHEYGRRLLYAELVKMDQPPEQPDMDPREAIQVLARACEAAPQCEPESCPLHGWCMGLGHDSVPKTWKRDPVKQ